MVFPIILGRKIPAPVLGTGNTVFSSKFLISVVDLTQLHLATEEDIQAHRDCWYDTKKEQTP
jgi:hypothetical protein